MYIEAQLRTLLGSLASKESVNATCFATKAVLLGLFQTKFNSQASRPGSLIPIIPFKRLVGVQWVS